MCYTEIRCQYQHKDAITGKDGFPSTPGLSLDTLGELQWKMEQDKINMTSHEQYFRNSLSLAFYAWFAASDPGGIAVKMERDKINMTNISATLSLSLDLSNKNDLSNSIRNSKQRSM